MSSSRSPSPDSNSSDLLPPPDPLRLAGSDRTQPALGGPFSANRWRQRGIGLRNWPILFLLPVLIAIAQAAAITPLVHLLFGESFGLTSGRAAPWPGGLALVGLAGFYSTLALAKVVRRAAFAQVLAFVCWIAGTLLWLSTIPGYDVNGLVADPWSLVSAHGYMVAPVFLAMGCWWQGIRYASDAALMAADEVRSMIQRCWALLLGGIVFSAIMDNPSADAAIGAARIAVPVAAIATMALLAAAETESTRQVARRRGAKGPQWSRWLKLVSSLSGVALVLALIVIGLLGPDALSATVHGIATVGRLLLIGAGYILYALFYLVYQVIRAVYYLVTLIFGDMEMKPPARPQFPGQQQQPMQLEQQQEPEPWEQAELIRWIALVIAIVIVAIILFRFSRRRPALTGDGVVDEERDSVFSSGLLRNQLKDLFRRRERSQKIPTLDLTATPATIREAFMFLHVLANRQATGRLDAETPDDFARRLRGVWPGTADSLRDLVRGYQRVRYGDVTDAEGNPDLPQSQRAWGHIWDRRKDWVPPIDEDKDNSG